MHPLLSSRGRKPRTGQVLTCPVCHVDYYVSPSGIRRKYHTRACWAQVRAQVLERQVTSICAQCGIEFNQAQSVGHKFHSRECYELSRLPHAQCKRCGEELPNAKRKYCTKCWTGHLPRTGIERPCEVCGVMMYVAPYLISSKRAHSRACNDELKRIDGPGSRMKRADGYIAVYYPKHPNAAKDGRVLEHRLVMEQKLGRPLLKAEEVNHINHVRDDNRPENLELISRSDHARESTAWGVAKRKGIRERLAEYERRFGPLS